MERYIGITVQRYNGATAQRCSGTVVLENSPLEVGKGDVKIAIFDLL